jgi:glycosyltransferase involved in cell wall biosynthesis
MLQKPIRSHSQAAFQAPNLLQVVPTLDTGGVEQTVLDISEAVIAAGGRSVVASHGGRLAEALRKGGAKLVRLPVHSKNPFVQWQNIGALKRVILRDRIDIVHVRSRAPAIPVLRAAKATGAASVSTYHGIYNDKGPFKRWYNSMMTRTDIVIANSDYTREHILDTYSRVDPDLVVSIPRGIRLEAFDPRNVDADAVESLRKNWGLIGETRTVFLLAARLTRWKGHTLIIEAAARLKQQGVTDFLVIMAGDDQGRSQYSQELALMIRQYGVENNVRLVGHCTNMPAAFSLCDFALAPSIEPEAFGRTAVEPQAMRRPVLAAAHGATRETILPQVTGYLVRPGDVEAWAEAMKRALALSPEERAQMGEAGRAHVLANFSLETMCDRTLEIYQRLMSQGYGHR